MKPNNIKMEWRDIEGFQGLYQVSCTGLVRSLDMVVPYKDGRVRVQKGRILKPGNNVGYARVNLVKNGKVFPALVHRLVAKAFIPNPDKLPFINHKDFNRRNNSVDNLEWCSPLENHQHTLKHGRAIDPSTAFYQKHGENAQRYNVRKVVQVYPDGKEVVWNSIKDALLNLGKNQKDGSISNACKHGIRAYGYHWRYVL